MGYDIRRMIPGTNFATMCDPSKITDISLGSLVHQANRTLTNAEILAITDPGTLPEIIPTPGLNKLLIFISGGVFPNFITGYTLPAGSTTFLCFVYGDFDQQASSSTDNEQIVSLTGKMALFPIYVGAPISGQETDIIAAAMGTQNDCVNKPIKFYAQSPSPYTWTGGNAANQMLVSVEFRVLDLVEGKLLTTLESGWDESSRIFE